MKPSKKQIILIFATILTIAVNAIAEIFPLNGMTVAEISNKFGSYFVPAGYVFAIWGVIYLLLLGFSLGLSLTPKKAQAYAETIFPWYIISCILNCAWIVLWHYEFIYTTVVVMVALLSTLAVIYQILLQHPPKTFLERLFLHIPFYVYIGWISVATIANISDALWLAHWSLFDLAGQDFAAIMMLVAGALAGYITLTTVDIFFGLVVIWALVGIVVKFPTEMPIMTAGIVAVVFIAATWIFRVVLNKKIKK